MNNFDINCLECLEYLECLEINGNILVAPIQKNMDDISFNTDVNYHQRIKLSIPLRSYFSFLCECIHNREVPSKTKVKNSL